MRPPDLAAALEVSVAVVSAARCSTGALVTTRVISSGWGESAMGAAVSKARHSAIDWGRSAARTAKAASIPYNNLSL